MSTRTAAVGEALFGLAAVAIRRRPRTLSLTAISVLSTLERTGPRRLTDLAASEEVTQPSMTALVTQLVDLGLAERRRDPADARVVLVAGTDAGSRQLREMRASGALTVTELIDKLDDHDTAALDAALPALLRLMELADESQDGRTPPKR
ncbi:MarR family transcriptional regulator [Kribbella solani]|uniref:MarR family winged helix-turn-helix transcriptional regulator n=1 Tax=Kribbella solani TaxID=236067 RepID=UPI0029A43859|nr:MarR family transcriptional regulator [Kribbella solani]MDX2973544.1 MarR family transcriptional regulator [Kribbella solani]MDX3003039.1 MarR family transcriptional regulator [Kribbella solani]